MHLIHTFRPLLLGLSLFVGVFLPLRAENFEALCEKARQACATPWLQTPSQVPEWLRAPQLSYDQYRAIRFKPSRARWQDSDSPFRLQFFHPGFVQLDTVSISEQDATKPIPFLSEDFEYGPELTPGPIPPDMGFSGFRLHFPLNQEGVFDDLAVFQGASYFRVLCQGSAYGLSARGLAVNTACEEPEDFPVFEEFWLQRPDKGAQSLTVLAYLNGRSVTGAYQFTITPGTTTQVKVRARIFLRHPVRHLGLAPLTSMFWHGEHSPSHYGDFRPEVHDSDGLALSLGSGERLWRPLSNPRQTRMLSFHATKLTGFGLFQRDRDFEHYQDLEAHYERRPSAWVEPEGDWGPGSVRLVELPTPDETNDNIVAFWEPSVHPKVGEAYDFAYSLKWSLETKNPDTEAWVAATRTGHSATHQPELQRFFVDFEGLNLPPEQPDAQPMADITVGAGALLEHATLQKLPKQGAWRIAFAIKPDGSGRPVELRACLRSEGKHITEIWSYLWNP